MEWKKLKTNNNFVTYVGLFSSMSTLVCCALPALLVSLGLGATMVGLVSTFPQIIWLSENKTLVFGVSFILLAVSCYMQYRAQFLPCPIDVKEKEACMKARLISKRMTIFSVGIWAIGAAFAYLPLLLK